MNPLPSVAICWSGTQGAQDPGPRLGHALFPILCGPWKGAHLGEGLGLQLRIGLALPDLKGAAATILIDLREPTAHTPWPSAICLDPRSFPGDEALLVQLLVELVALLSTRPLGLWVEAPGSAADPLLEQLCALETQAGRPVLCPRREQPDVLVLRRDAAWSGSPERWRPLLQAKGESRCAVVLDAGEELEREPWLGANLPSCPEARGRLGVQRAVLLAWLREELLRRRAGELTHQLPPFVSMARPPEALDLVQEPLVERPGALVLHPDPPLSELELAPLRRLRPRLRVCTPSTAVGRVLAQGQELPLLGLTVAFSAADGPLALPRAPGPGWDSAHLHHLMRRVARTLLQAGARLAYGGDLRPQGYTEALAQIQQAHSRLAGSPDRPVLGWLRPEGPDRSEVLPGLELVSLRPDLAPEELVGDRWHVQMRRQMAQDTDARVLIGGRAPQAGGSQESEAGRLPGILEEAWHHLNQGKPIYALGGFGGAAELLGELLWGDGHDKTGSPGGELPQKLEELQGQLRGWRGRLPDNGLEPAESRQLRQSTDPDEICRLLLKGLTRLQGRGQGQGQVVLWPGSLIEAPDAQALLLARVEGLPPRGALQAVVERGGEAVLRGSGLVALHSPKLEANWALVLCLNHQEDAQAWERAIEEGCRQHLRDAAERGLDVVAAPPMGISLGLGLERSLEALLRGAADFLQEPDRRLIICEPEARREGRIWEMLRGRLPLRPQRLLPSWDLPTVGRPPHLWVVEEGRLLRRGLEEGTAVEACSLQLPDTLMQKLRGGLNQQGQLPRHPADHGRSPTLSMAREWGEELTGALFQEGQAPPLPQARQGAPALELWLDPQRADLPWELLLLKDAQGEPQPLGTRVDLRRRLIRRCSGGPQQESEGSGLRVLLVANPREDHPELEEDLQSTMELLQRLPAAEVWALSGAEAKPGDFQKALRRRPQVLHFAGHGNVDYFRPVASGIFLQGDQLWGSLNLPNDQPLPELWILAACTSLRLPTAGQTHGGKALAQTLLERGVRAVIGSYWDLEVQTARDLSARLYPALLRGERLGPALLEVRQHLYQRGSPDWCNLLLYGDGDWRLA